MTTFCPHCKGPLDIVVGISGLDGGMLLQRKPGQGVRYTVTKSYHSACCKVCGLMSWSGFPTPRGHAWHMVDLNLFIDGIARAAVLWERELYENLGPGKNEGTR